MTALVYGFALYGAVSLLSTLAVVAWVVGEQWLTHRRNAAKANVSLARRSTW